MPDGRLRRAAEAPWGPHGCLSGDGCKELPTPTPVDLMAQAESYISYIVSHQASDGWLGPAASGGSLCCPRGC